MQKKRESHSQTLKSPTYSILEGKLQSCATTEGAFPRKPIIPHNTWHSGVRYFQRCAYMFFLMMNVFPENLFLYIKTIYLMDTHAPNTLNLVLSDVIVMVTDIYKVCPQMAFFHDK